MATTNFPVHITTACTLNPSQVPPPGGVVKCQKGSTVTFTNDNPGEVTLNFAGLANPFGATPPITVPGGGSSMYSVSVGPAPGKQLTYNYSLSCNAAVEGIIIVDGGGGPKPHPRKRKKAPKKKTASGTRGKSKPKAKPKRGSAGTRKKSKGKTKKTAGRKRK